MVTMIERSVHLLPGLSSSDVELFDLDVWRFSGELRCPLRTSQGEIAKRDSVIVRLRANVAGFTVAGWGEAAPLDGWSIEKLSQVRFELGRAHDMIAGGATTSPLDVLDRLTTPTGRFAFSSALLDAAAHARRRPLRQLFDSGAPHSISLNATIGLVTPHRAVELARNAWQQGFRTLKLKIGDEHDHERVRRVREALGGVALRLDCNTAWSGTEAVERLSELAPYNIEYVEQPVADRDQLAEITARSPIPIAADESCLPLETARELVSGRMADVLVLKPALLGAWGDVIPLVAAAQAAEIKVVFSSAIDSAVGRTATAQMAAAVLGGEVACGLATDWFRDDLGGGEDRVRNGRLFLGSGNGLGLPLTDDRFAGQS